VARLVPKLLLTALAVYVVWADTNSTEEVPPYYWLVDAVIVGFAGWSWISYLREKPKE
jgi:hypothetical protein